MDRLSRRVMLAAAASVCSMPTLGQGAAYPNRAIRLIVPFPPGVSVPGVIGRVLADQMALGLGQPVVVDHKPGASGALGTQAVALAPADGHTLLLVDRGALGLMPALNPRLGYDPLKSFAYIGIVADSTFALAVNPALGVTTMAEFAALVKAKPGELNYGSFGIGSMAHLNFEMLNARLGLRMQHVPYKNTVEAMAAVAAGEVQAGMSGLPAVLGLARDGRLRVLAIGANARSSLLPNVPTVAEAGLPADLMAPTFFALAAPAGTPPPLLVRLHAEMKVALADAEVNRRLRALGLTPAGGGATDVEAIIQQDLAEFGRLIRTLGIILE